MKRLALAAAAIAGVTPVSAEHKWTGFYTGLSLGGAQAESEFTDIAGYNGTSNFVFPVDADGAFVSAIAGINGRVDDFVYGIELEVADLALDGAAAQPNSPDLDTIGAIEGGLALSASARLGYLIEDTLVFVKAGLAGVETGASILDICVPAGGGEGGEGGGEGGETGFTALVGSAIPVADPRVVNRPGCGPDTLNGAGDGFVEGYVLGIGIEHPIAEGWTARLEYSFYQLDGETFAAIDANGATFNYSHDTDVDVLKVAVTWQFGTPE
jgi:outer membrane immunogenic protein